MSTVDGAQLIGQTIAGRYEVIRLIGRGGMGSIYEVRHLKVRRAFALKQLAPSLADDTEALARFQREADVVASLRHPNIVEIVDWETLPDGSPCMIMELLRGEDLSARLARVGPLPWREVAVITDQVLSALAVTHRAGIIHRDLKPQNIFLTRDDAGEEHVKLLDFGVSKVHSGGGAKLTGDDRRIGTPAYMSPEQADGQTDQIGPATDVWAMGAILHEMATAKLAFSATSAPSMLYRICHGAPAKLERADAPPAFLALVGDLLSREPSRRVVDVDTLRRRLREALAGEVGNGLRDPSQPTPLPSSVSGLDRPSAVAHRPGTTLSGASGQLRAPSMSVAGRRARWPLLAGIGALVVAVGAAAAILAPRYFGSPPAPAVTAIPTPRVKVPETPPPLETPLRVGRPPLKVKLRLQPSTARVHFDDVPVAGSALTFADDDQAHTLRVTAPGHVDHTQRVDARTPPVLDVKLRATRHDKGPKATTSTTTHPTTSGKTSPLPLDP